MTAQPVNNKAVKDFWRMTQIAGLAFSIPFEIAVGPFIGYFIGAYLRDKFGIHRYIVFIFILMGFIASVANVVVTIEMIIKISKEKSRVINAKN